MQRVLATVCVAASLGPALTAGRLQREATGPRTVSRQELVAAMRTQRGYNVAATTNGARFESAVMLELAAIAAKSDTARRPLVISRADWLEAFIEATGTARDAVPPGVRLSAEHRQDITIEYDATRVVKRVKSGPSPLQALTVRHEWPATTGTPGSFTYEDRSANPPVRVTNSRRLEYRLLRFADFVAYERMEGYRARPLSGFSALLLTALGDVSIVASRFAIGPAGTMVGQTRVRVVGVITRTVGTTVYPDGRLVEGIAVGNPDLAALAAKLEAKTDIEFH